VDALDSQISHTPFVPFELIFATFTNNLQILGPRHWATKRMEYMLAEYALTDQIGIQFDDFTDCLDNIKEWVMCATQPGIDSYAADGRYLDSLLPRAADKLCLIGRWAKALEYYHNALDTDLLLFGEESAPVACIKDKIIIAERELYKGCHVRIHGLSTSSEFNGEDGVICGLAESGRCIISLYSGARKAVKAGNLHRVDLHAGCPVRIHSLKSAVLLNGVLGRLQELLPTARWKVQLSNGEVKSLKPENLQSEELYPGCRVRLHNVKHKLVDLTGTSGILRQWKPHCSKWSVEILQELGLALQLRDWEVLLVGQDKIRRESNNVDETFCGISANVLATKSSQPSTINAEISDALLGCGATDNRSLGHGEGRSCEGASYLSASTSVRSISWVSSPARLSNSHCFPSYVSFMRPGGEWVQAARLRPRGGDILLGPCSTHVRVVKAARHLGQRDLVRLRTALGSIEVTADHRLLIEGASGDATPEEARLFKQWDVTQQVDDGLELTMPPRIFDGQNFQTVLRVESFMADIPVVELTFERDSDIVLAWTFAGRRPRTVLPGAATACLGRTSAADYMELFGFVESSTFLDDRRAIQMGQRNRSAGAEANSCSLWSAGTRFHDQGGCSVCWVHHRHVSQPQVYPCCKREAACHMCHASHPDPGERHRSRHRSNRSAQTNSSLGTQTPNA